MATAEDQVNKLCHQTALRLTDVGKYSIAQLCVSLLCNINETESDVAWSKTYVSKLVEDIGLPVKVSISLCMMLEESMQAEVEDQGNLEPLSRTLGDEPSLSEDISLVILELIRLSLKQNCYDARARVLIFVVGRKLGVGEAQCDGYEDDLAASMTLVMVNNEKNDEEANKRKSRRNKKKAFFIGLGVVAGGAIIGLTGGLAAPVVAASAGALIGGSGATFLASSAGLAFITSVFGATGAGLTGYKMNRRVGMTEEFEFVTLSPVRRLNVTICVSGWLLEDETDEFTTQWAALSSSLESYSLKWESKFLLELGTAIRDLVTSNVVGVATVEALKYTVLQGLMAAIAWPATLLNAAAVIDNPWSVCASRAQEVGRELARVLLSRRQGRRPVTLIGFSLGARVIYYCLEELSALSDSGGIVQDAILLGAPVNGNEKRWEKFSGVVAGIIVNGFCQKDWFLRFVYRATAMRYNVAGLSEVTWKNRRMVNVDLTDIVHGHMDYADPEKLGAIFDIIGVKTDSEVRQSFVSKQASEDCTDTHCLVREILDEQINIAIAVSVSKETPDCEP